MSTIKDPKWYREGVCRGTDPNLFIFNEHLPKKAEGDEPSNEKNFLIAERICATCPVIGDCWNDSDDDDKMFTMRGGAWPDQFYVNPPGRPSVPTCKRDHDTSAPGSRDKRNECVECKRERARASKKRRKPVNPGPRRRQETCKRGHDTTDPESRNNSGRCRQCRPIQRRERIAAEKQAMLD